MDLAPFDAVNVVANFGIIPGIQDVPAKGMFYDLFRLCPERFEDRPGQLRPGFPVVVNLKHKLHFVVLCAAFAVQNKVYNHNSIF